VFITLFSEAEMFQPHELLREPKEVAASHKHCLELAPAHIRILAARGESWRALLDGRFAWRSAGVVVVAAGRVILCATLAFSGLCSKFMDRYS